MVAGRGELPSVLKDNFSIKEIGYIFDQGRMAKAYSAADIYVMSSTQDNLPNVMLESLACGTPVVCFNVGGISDAVEHLKNGYLAKNKDSDDLARGMDTLLNDPELPKRFRVDAVDTITKKFSEALQAKRHIDLYREILEKQSKST